MDGSVDRIQPQVRILPPKPRRERRGGKRFVVDPEGNAVRVEDEPEEDSGERALGHKTHDEAGARLDVTA